MHRTCQGRSCQLPAAICRPESANCCERESREQRQEFAAAAIVLPSRAHDAATYICSASLCSSSHFANCFAALASALLNLSVPSKRWRHRRAALVKRIGSQLLLLARIVVSALFATASFATTQSIDAVQAAAEEFVRSRLPASHAKQFVTAAKLDPRLRVESCEQPLQTFEQSATTLGERVTVGVRCAAANTWTLYVPVSVEVEIPVLVLRRALARRARVAIIDVEPQTRRVPGTRCQLSCWTRASLQGHRLKRSLPAGTALTVDMLVPDVVVRRGQQVTLIAASGPGRDPRPGTCVDRGRRRRSRPGAEHQLAQGRGRRGRKRQRGPREPALRLFNLLS